MSDITIVMSLTWMKKCFYTLSFKWLLWCLLYIGKLCLFKHLIYTDDNNKFKKKMSEVVIATVVKGSLEKVALLKMYILKIFPNTQLCR